MVKRDAINPGRVAAAGCCCPDSPARREVRQHRGTSAASTPAALPSACQLGVPHATHSCARPLAARSRLESSMG